MGGGKLRKRAKFFFCPSGRFFFNCAPPHSQKRCGAPATAITFIAVTIWLHDIVHVFQKCGLLTKLDENFLANLQRNNVAIEDTRVAQAMCTMLQRNLLVITSRPTEASCVLYRPFNAKPVKGSLAVGHISDHHFVPLRRKGNLFCVKH